MFEEWPRLFWKESNEKEERMDILYQNENDQNLDLAE